MKKRIIISVLAVWTAIWLAACGKSVENSNEPEKEYAYLPEYVELEMSEWVSCQNIRFAGDCVYYNRVFFDVVNQTNVPVLKEYSLTERKVLRQMNLLSDTEDGFKRHITDYWVQDDGKMYTAESVYSYNSNARFTFLCAYDAEWNQEWEMDITGIMDGVKNYSQTAHIAVDRDGFICLAADDNTLCLFDGEGNHLGNVVLEDAGIRGTGTDRSGKAYVCYQRRNNISGNGYCLAAIDFKEKIISDICQDFPEFPDGRTFTAGSEADFLVNDTDHVYGYDLTGQSQKELLSWIDCDINGHAVDALSTGADGGLVAFLRDGSSGGSYLVFLRKVEAAALPQKTQIVIGCIGSNSELQAEAAAFNRQSSNCHVTIRNYAEGNNGLPEDGQDPSAVLGMAIATGIDCPDILSLEELELYQMDIEAFTGNGAFEDQTPFLERSSILTPEDYPENVLDSFRYQGVLAGIPYNLALRTVVGRASDVGNENGWTLDEMMAYAAEHPQQELFSGAVRDDILYDCLAFNQNLFIDWESGQCHFDSEEFKRLLLFAAAFPAEYDYGADERSVPRKIQDGDVLLYKAYMDNFYVVQEHETMFGEPITYIGYPAADSSGCLLKCGGALAISAQSQNKEAAWEFIEYHLSREADKNMSGFPARSSMLEQQMQEATTVSYYVDEQGEPLLDADGKPVPQSLGGVQWSFADEEIIFRTATKEEVLQVKKLIETSRTAPTSNDTVLMIIQEEAEPFFLGQKPVENVMGIIQHRVQIYMDERS